MDGSDEAQRHPPSRPYRGRGGSSRGGGGSRGGGSSRGRGRGGYRGGHNGFQAGGGSFDMDDSVYAGSFAAPPPMFPVSYQDTSSFQLPSASSSASSSFATAAPPQTDAQRAQAKMKAGRTKHAAPVVVLRQHRQKAAQQQPEEEEGEDEEDFEDDSDFDDFDDDEEDWCEDEENIFDMAEVAFIDGQRQQALKQQRLQQQQQMQQNPQAPPHGKKQKQKQQPPAGRQQQQHQQQQPSSQSHSHSHSGPQKPPLQFVTKKELERMRVEKRLERQEARQIEQAFFRPNQGLHAPPQAHSNAASSSESLTHRERRQLRAEAKKLHTQQFQRPAQQTPPPQQQQQPQTYNQQAPSAASASQSRPASARPAGGPQQPPPQQYPSRYGSNNTSRGGAAFFPEHLPRNIMEIGVRQGLYLQGLLRIVGSNAFVTVAGVKRDIFIDGRKNRNRAFDGDTVCIQITGHDTGVGTQQHPRIVQKGGNASSGSRKNQRGGTSLQASLESLILATELEEDAKMAQEKKAGQKKKGDKNTSATTETPVEEEDQASLSPLLAQLASSGPDVQHKGLVLGILASKSREVRAPGLLKPFSAHLALFVPSDKRTPFALVAEREWPPTFAVAYRTYLRAQEEAKALKKQALKTRKQKGNFPDASQDSSDVVNMPSSSATEEEEPAEVDAMTAAADPNSVTLDSHIYVGLFEPWLARDRQPFARIERSLGESGDIRSETEALLVANGIDYDHDGAFSRTVLDEVAGYARGANGEAGWQIPAEELARRRDLRDQNEWRIVSIDPTTARDLDDAIHIKDLHDGTVEIGVHIADVSAFVRPGTALDAEARHRATTVYLTQKALPMLPPILCEQLCSLNPNVDRLAYSAIFYMEKATGRLCADRKPWFGRSVIRTCCRLNYETAQLLMELDRSQLPTGTITEESFTGDLRAAMSLGSPYRPAEGVAIGDLLDDMQLLHTVSMKRRADRFERGGSLTLSNVKLQFALDASREVPIGFHTYEVRDSNRVVEECMLLANLLVAKQCVDFCRDIALLRRHPPPNERSMTRVSQACAELGFDIDATTAGDLQRSLDAYEAVLVGAKHSINDAEPPTKGTVPVRHVLEPLCTKPMQLATYFCTGPVAEEPREWRHYALAFDEYTHFTSPIRRYADVIVHRILTHSLELESWKAAHASGGASRASRPRADKSLAPSEIMDIAESCNTRKAAAKKAQEASSKLFLCDYLLRHHADVPLSASGVITDMFSVENNADPSFDILIPHLGLEKKIHLNDLLKQAKILDARIEPHDPPEQGKQQQQQQQGGGKNNRQARRQEKQPNNGAAAAGASTAPVLKSAKRLHITWLDGTSNVYAIFEAIDVELAVRRGPPMDLDAFVISPATAEERTKKSHDTTTSSSSAVVVDAEKQSTSTSSPTVASSEPAASMMDSQLAPTEGPSN